MPLSAQIEGVLFFRATPVTKATLKSLFGVDDLELGDALAELNGSLSGRGVALIETDREVSLVTAPELHDCIEALQKDDLKSDISKAGAETLAIILYREPVSRAEIDQIRGVNSSFILRNLLTRGLVARSKTKSGFEFRTTPELLAHLGVRSKDDLTEYADVMDRLDAYAQESELNS